MNRLSRFLKLPFSEKILLGEAFLLVPAIRLILWFVPFKVFKKSFAQVISRESDLEDIDWRQISSIIRSVKTISRFVPAASCLTQALSALLLIKLNGQHSDLKIGVAKNDKAELIAHAWLEINGRIILGKLPTHRKYTVLDSLFG